jgi:hypothetical protein
MESKIKMTVIEVESKKAQLTIEMGTALEASKALQPGTSEFDGAYERYFTAKNALAKIPEELQKAKIEENAGAIKVAGNQVAEATEQLIAALNIESLIGAPVIAANYYRIASKDEQGNPTVSKGVIFNPVTPKRALASETKRESKAGHTMIVAPDGTRLSLTKFAAQYATNEEKVRATFKTGFTPHALVDTKPKFDAFCTAHSLTGYTYEIPK